MSDKAPKCPTCHSSKDMQQSTFPKDGTYANVWLCLKCDTQDYAFKDIEQIAKVEERDE